MILRRTLPLLIIVFFLAGCFRQAEDTFDTVGSSQNSEDIGITQDPIISESATPTDEIEFIDPNATDAEVESANDEASATPRTISPTDADNDSEANTQALTIPTATEAVASATPFPTATEPTFITPEVIQEVELASPTPRADDNSPTLEPSPTVFDTVVELGDCDYEVQDGDNLFRIAINNDIDLADLLRVNNLSEASIIQPGQILTIPNCDGDSSISEDGADAEIIPTAIVLDDCEYEIQDGDTLFAIAVDNDVTLADLLAENNLTEDVVIQPGDILRIPNCIDSDGIDNAETDESDTAVIASDEPIVHVVEAGDTLQTISSQYGVSVNAIVQANTIPNVNRLTVGQQLTIPTPTSDEE
ncbi:MAG: LysM peptidoglycan-binding domain-containing protein [Chloroflexota bacterium]